MSGWPPGLDPARAPVATYHERVVPLPPERVWHRLVAARDWPRWYPNARRVDLPGDALGPGTVFRWTTSGVRVVCRVEVFRPYAELAWSGRVPGASGYHRWVLEPLPDGRTRVVTEETRRGWLARAGARWMHRDLVHWHQVWLDAIG